MSKEEQMKKDWKSELPPETYHVMREKGTERAYTGKYNDHKQDGKYLCAACKSELFDSSTKFESGSGWPSFHAPVSNDNIKVEVDKSHGMIREEVQCSNCGGHLGHVFSDGPNPTGLRFCINSAALDFTEKQS